MCGNDDYRNQIRQYHLQKYELSSNETNNWAKYFLRKAGGGPEGTRGERSLAPQATHQIGHGQARHKQEALGEGNHLADHPDIVEQAFGTGTVGDAARIKHGHGERDILEAGTLLILKEEELEIG